MSDAMKIPQNQAVGVLVRKNGFMATTGGKVIVVVMGLAMLAVVLGIAAAVILYFALGPEVSGATNGAVAAVSETSASVEATAVVATKPAEPAAALPNEAVFTFRDIFDPLLNALPESANTTNTGSNDNTSTPTSDGTLYLQNITTVDGVLHAVLLLDGVTYTLSADESIPGTPWEVLSVRTTSVTMLYGDTQVVLAIGQGVNK